VGVWSRSGAVSPDAVLAWAGAGGCNGAAEATLSDAEAAFFGAEGAGEGADAGGADVAGGGAAA
jgi:hypothetical protein